VPLANHVSKSLGRNRPRRLRSKLALERLDEWSEHLGSKLRSIKKRQIAIVGQFSTYTVAAQRPEQITCARQH
jgi:hypothetical protein